jgi:hypothetical protein
MHVSFRSTVTAGLLGFVTLAPITKAGEAGLPSQKYQVLAPISQGNLTVFPVVASNTYDTAKFLTLDEGCAPVRSSSLKPVSDPGWYAVAGYRRHNRAAQM